VSSGFLKDNFQHETGSIDSDAHPLGRPAQFKLFQHQIGQAAFSGREPVKGGEDGAARRRLRRRVADEH